MASILFHDPRLSSITGGGETVTLQLAGLLATAGHDVTILTKRAPHSQIYDEAARRFPSVRFVEIEAPMLENPADALAGDFTQDLWHSDRLAAESLSFNVATRNFYDGAKFDLCVVSFILDLAGLSARGPVLLNVFGLPPDAVIAALERPLLDQCSGFTFASHYVRREFHSLFDLQPGRGGGPVIHASIHDEFFQARPPLAKRYDVCYAGRLVRRKGVHVLLQAIAWLKQNAHLAVSAAIAGDGSESASLRAMAAELAIERQVEWLGAVGTAELIRVLDQSRTFAYPTLKPEAFGCSNLEAMVRGVPVITTNLGGTADYVEPGVNALVCECDSPENLGHRIAELLTNTELAREIGRNARATAERFHPTAVRARWLTAFDDLLRRAV